MLLGLSYLALFVDKQNPGRPGIHSVTVLTELTLASAQRQQLPPVGNHELSISFGPMLTVLAVRYIEVGERRDVDYAVPEYDSDLPHSDFLGVWSRALRCSADPATAGKTQRSRFSNAVAKLSSRK